MPARLQRDTNRQSGAYSYARREQSATDSRRRPAAQDRRPGARPAFSFGGQLHRPSSSAYRHADPRRV